MVQSADVAAGKGFPPLKRKKYKLMSAGLFYFISKEEKRIEKE